MPKGQCAAGAQRRDLARGLGKVTFALDSEQRVEFS